MRTTRLFLTLALVAGLVLGAGPVPVAHAATITVNSTADVIADDGQCTLREAITAANTDTASGEAANECPAGSGADTVTLPAGEYTLTGAAGEDANASGDLDVWSAITIAGGGAETTFIQAGPDADSGIDRVFHVIKGNGDLTLDGVTVRYGDRNFGGGIYNAGTVTINNSTLSDNLALSGGGVLNSDGTTTVNNSTLSGNSATDGGGVLNWGGTTTVNNSTLSDNRVTAEGGGVYNVRGTVTINESTLSRNSATAEGGGVFNDLGTLTVDNSTFSGNVAKTEGGGVYNLSGTATINTTTLTGNAANISGGGIGNYDGTVTINESTLSGNVSQDDGGGVHNWYGALTVDNSTLYDNSVIRYGGGVYNHSGAVEMNNSTLSDNWAGNRGGGVYNYGADATVNMVHCTLTLNAAGSGYGGGIRNYEGSVWIKNTIVINNGGDCEGVVTTLGYNFVFWAGGCGPRENDLTTSQDWGHLDPLADNGGPTQTHHPTLWPESPPVNAIPAGVNGCGSDYTRDQRGAIRPIENACEIGAVEVGWVPNAPVPVLESIDPGAAQAGSADVTITLNGADFVPASRVKWNGTTDLLTTYVNAGQLTAVIPASLIETVQTAQVTVYTPPSGGGTSNVLAFYVTTADVGVTEQVVASGTKPEAAAGDGLVNVRTMGEGLLAVAIYDGNPGGSPGFNPTGTYFDVYISPAENFDTIEIIACGPHTGVKLHWWNPDSGQWEFASHQDGFGPCTTGWVTSYTSPSLSQLSGTAFTTEINSVPVTSDDSYTTDEDTPLSVPAPGVLANDTDADGDPLSVMPYYDWPDHGRLTLNEDGSFTYTPYTGYSGTDSFLYWVTDGWGETYYGTTVEITVNPIPDSPVAGNDTYITNEDTALTVEAPGVLGNDSDEDGDALTAVLDSSPANGTLALNADGSFSYTPNAGFTGTDSSTYHAHDGALDSNVATVTITVNALPVAVDDEYSTDEDTPLTVAAPGVLGNDSDPDGDPLTAVLDSGPANGTLDLAADGSFTYDPDLDFCGQDSFSYTISDGNGGSDAAAVSVGVACVQDAPVAVGDNATTDEHTAVTIDVLDNDSDGDGDALTIVSITYPRGYGVVTNNGTNVTYTPNKVDWCPGSAALGDSFEYEISDGHGGSATATVWVYVTCVDDPPEAVDDTATVTQYDAVTTIDVLANDNNPDYGPMSIGSVTQPANGTAAITNGGADLTYEPDLGYCNDGSPTDDFTYTLAPGDSTATVRVTVTCVNDPPAANNDSYSTGVGTPLNVPAPGVLGTDSDADNDPLTAVKVTDPSHGTLALESDGSFTYTPDADYHGTDSFTYQANDGTADSNVATVSLAVEAAVPVLTGIDPAAAQEGSSDVTLTLTGSDLVSASQVKWKATAESTTTDLATTYVDAGQLSAVIPASLLTTVRTAQVTVYTPAPGGGTSNVLAFFVTEASAGVIDQDVVSGTDPSAASGPATAAADGEGLLVVAEYDANPGGTPSFTASGTYFDVYAAPDATFSQVTIQACGLSSVDTLYWWDPVSEQWIEASPQSYDAGTGCITLTVTDGSSPSLSQLSGTVFVAGNHAPVAANDSYSTSEDTTLNVAAAGVLANDSDADGNALTTVLDTPTSHGIPTLNGDGSFSYTPGADYCGADSFTYHANDGLADSNVATVGIQVACVNDPPVLGAIADKSVNEGTELTFTATATDPDSGDTLTFSLVGAPAGASIYVSTGVFSWTPADDGSATFTVRVCDDGSPVECDEQEITVTVNNVSPDVTADPASQTCQYSDYVCEVAFEATDVAADTMMASAVPSWNSLSLGAASCTTSEDGIWQTCTWTLAGTMDEPAGNYEVTVTVTDGGSGSASTTITVVHEDADIWLGSENPVAVQVDSAGGDSGPFSLIAYVQETPPDTTSQACGTPDLGDINNAEVSMTLVAVGPGDSYTTNPCTNVEVVDGVLKVQCDFDGVAVNTYHVQAEVAGDYYVSGVAEDVLVVYDPSLGFTTGGGWFYWPGKTDKTNFGYTMKYNKKGKKVQGSFLLIRHASAGNYRVKSNALDGLALGDGAGFGWASFSGKATYAEPGWLEPEGNHSFVVYVEDHGQTGDQVWIEVHDKGGNVIDVMSFARETLDHLEPIQGGNIVVPH